MVRPKLQTCRPLVPPHRSTFVLERPYPFDEVVGSERERELPLQVVQSGIQWEIAGGGYGLLAEPAQQRRLVGDRRDEMIDRGVEFVVRDDAVHQAGRGGLGSSQ